MQRKTVQLIDDLDGGPADETVPFGLDTQRLEIDLSSENATRLREVLAPYLAKARRVGGRKIARKPTSPRSEAAVKVQPSRKRTSSKVVAKDDGRTVDKAGDEVVKRSTRRKAPAGKGSTKVTFVEPAASDIRAWARSRNISVAPRGRVPDEVKQAFLEHSAPTDGRGT